MSRLSTVIAFLAVTACGASQVKDDVLRVSSTENGLWTICYDDKGDPELHETRAEQHSCKNPSIVKWPSLPVKVHLNNGFDPNVALRTFAVWKDWLGTEVFELVPESGPNVVEVIQANEEETAILSMMGAAALAPHTKLVDGTLLYTVFFQPHYATEDVMAHELGHVLGLAHDKGPANRRSIMFPSASWYLPHLSAYDTAILRHLYHI